MGDHDHAPLPKQTAQAGPVRAAPAPKANEPSHVAELRRQLKHGAAVVTWLRDIAIPNLASARGGILGTGTAQDRVAYRGLATVKDVLDRTQDAGNGPLIQQALELPRELVELREQLEADYDALTTEVAVLAAALHGLPAPPQAPAPKPAMKATPSAKPTPVVKQLEKPKGRDKETPAIPAKTVTQHVAGPPSFDFGKALPGTTHELTGVLFNLVDHGASVKVSLSGSPAFKLQSSPHQLVKRGEQPPVGSQDIVVKFAAPTPRGSHHGNVHVDLSWAGGTKPETLNIPVVGHSLLSHESTDDEIAVRKREQSETDARAKHVKHAEDELAAFDRAHPGFAHNGFNDKLRDVDAAMRSLVRAQESGINRARDEIAAYVKAPPPPAKPSVLFELGMIVLDIASAGVANMVAKGIEGGLKTLAKGAAETVTNPISGKVAPAVRALVLDESTIYGVSDAMKEGFKIASKRARPSPGGGDAPATKRRETVPDDSADPRVAFIQAIQNQQDQHQYQRDLAATHTAALLRPTLFKDPALAIKALEAIQGQLVAEHDHATKSYYQAAIRRWFDFISQLDTGVHRVGSVDGAPIKPARGVVDIGFQVTGPSPRDRVIPKTAIMRGVSNAAIKDLKNAALLHTFVPIRVYGMPSHSHAELLVSVTRDSSGAIKFLDHTNGSAPGSGAWLRNRGGGSSERGAAWLLRDLLEKPLSEQGVVLTTDQAFDPEGG